MNEELNSPQDNRTEYQKAADLVWRAEGIEVVLRDKGEGELADKVVNAIQISFTLDPNDQESARAIQSFIWEAIEACDGYDSGVRKYEKPTDNKDNPA